MNQTPLTTTTYRSEPGGGPADPSVRRFVLLFLGGGLLVTLALFGRGEVSRWYQAEALNAIREQRYEDAIEAANKALQWDPENLDVVDVRAVARLRNNDFEGSVADLDEQLAALEQEDPDKDTDGERRMTLLAQKAMALQRLGRHQPVIAIWDEIVAFRKEEFRLRDDHDSRYDYAMALNNQAYMVAQAYVSTQDAETFDIGQALEQSSESMRVRQVEDDAVILDTYGYLLLLNGRSDEAVKMLERVVELTRAEHDAVRDQLNRLMQQVDDQRQIQDSFEELDKQFSIILHHRGEAYQAVGETEKAEQDLSEADRLGYNPEEGVW